MTSTTNTTPECVDVCVLGGGIIGLAVAAELLRRGREVCVLEASAGSTDAAARTAAGMLAPVSEADLSHPDLTRLSLASAAMYEPWAREIEARSGLNTGFETTGTLIVALHRDHMAEIEHLRAFQRDRGLDPQPLTRGELRALEPSLAPTVVGGMRVPGDHQVDPRRVLGALREAITRGGGRIVEGARATSVVAEGTDGASLVRFEERGEPHALHVKLVVVAAGAWSRAIEVPDLEIPVRPVKGQVLRLRGERLLNHVVRTPDVYLVPRADGELVVGATMEERGFDRDSRAGDVLDLLIEAARTLPGIRELTLAECNTGFRPALRDHLPAIGEARPGLLVATGHFRDGVLLAPITARLLGDLVCEGRIDALLASFAPGRFASVEPIEVRA